ncbi:MAG TPA: heme lyase CcmF/NrfE family subunit, partial [Chloroflexota bacterium]
GTVAGFLAGWRSRADLAASARNSLYVATGLLALASAVLVAALLRHDFALRYVYEHSSRAMPAQFNVAAFYSGQQGSLLYWALALGLLGSLAVARSWARLPALVPYVAAVLLGVEVFFLAVLAFVSSPFEVLPVAPPDGRGLNPLLYDAGMLIHPPMLLLGYSSVAVPFAFGMAALLSGRLDVGWLRATRRYALVAWAFLSAGNLLGAWWAYHVLGWGGYWGWDPVENSALLPWLVLTAYLHSAIVQERRGMLKVWSLGLLIATFALAVQGTFIVRSGIISSVHSFAQSAIGPYFFAFLALVVVGSVGLLLYRLPLLRDERAFESVVSRESGFLVNNFLLGGIAFATYWGTIFPLAAEAVGGAKVTVGAPFYQQVNGPLFLALLVLMGIGPLIPWRRATRGPLLRVFLWPVAAAGLAALGLVLAGRREPAAVLALATCALVAATIAWEYGRAIAVRRRTSGEGVPAALVGLLRTNRSRYGGYVVHLGVVLIAVGVAGSSFYRLEREATLKPGQRLDAGRYTLTYLGLRPEPGAGKQTVWAPMEVAVDGAPAGRVEPGKVTYRGFEQQPATEVGLRTLGVDDLYVVLAAWVDDGTATFVVFVNPLVSLIWVGGAVLLLGALVTAWPGRRPVPATAPARQDVAVLTEAVA